MSGADVGVDAQRDRIRADRARESRSISDIELTLMTIRSSPIARRSSSETFEQVNQISSRREAGVLAR